MQCPLDRRPKPGKSPRELVDEHIGRVFIIASQVGRGADVERGDLVAWGAEGLIEAADRFDPECGVTFATYASRRIRGAMRDGIRRLARCPPSPLDSLSVSSYRTPYLSSKLKQALTRMPWLERQLIQAHYGGVSLEDAAARLGRSRSWATRTHARVLRSLRKEFAGEPSGSHAKDPAFTATRAKS